jgi:hypothetical protein
VAVANRSEGVHRRDEPCDVGARVEGREAEGPVRVRLKLALELRVVGAPVHILLDHNHRHVRLAPAALVAVVLSRAYNSG